MNSHSWFYASIFVILNANVICSNEDACYDENCREEGGKSIFTRNRRYILYDVNPGEGFNLRRDVYMRIARLVNLLRGSDAVNDWILVLPPWGPLYHWKSNLNVEQMQIPWSKFFDLQSMSLYVPVVDLNSFKDAENVEIGVVYYLQHYADTFSGINWEEKMNVSECLGSPTYRLIDERYKGWFWGFKGMFTKEFHCVSVQGHSSTLLPLIEDSDFGSVMFDRAEVILHDFFGDSDYWAVRRSMRYAKNLRDFADEFRMKYLDSTDEQDKTSLIEDWRNVESVERLAIGGPYIAVHLRRGDYLRARPDAVPSIKYAAEQINEALNRLGLTAVYVATDGTASEFKPLKEMVPGAVRYFPSEHELNEFLDGGVAIIDQWICAHARYFIGSYESTFSFRIQEEREILGFEPDTTFNRFCSKNQMKCEQPSRWLITAD